MTEIDPTSTDHTVDFDNETLAGADVAKMLELAALDLQYVRVDFKLPRELLASSKLKKLELSPQDDTELVVDPLVSELPALEELHLQNVDWEKSAAEMMSVVTICTGSFASSILR